MYKNKKLLILVPLIAVVLLVGGTVGVAFAQNGPGADQDMLAKVAKILGIDQQKLVAAFEQVQAEQQAERLAQMVKDGKITQTQADQIKAWEAARPDPKADKTKFEEWLKARPDVPLPQPPGPRRDGPPPNLDEMLTQLVKDNKITQAQADQLKAWEAARPDPKVDKAKFEEWLKARPDVPLPQPPGPPPPPFK